MKDIPPDRRSTHELYEQFREAGARKARIQRQVRRRALLQHVPGPALGAVLAFLVVGGGIAVGTKVFVADDAPVVGDGDPGRDVGRSPGDQRVAQATAIDPVVGRARWGMRVYTNDQGASCAVAGRLVGARVGRVVDGRFHEYPDDVVNACNDLSTDHASVVKRPDAIDDQPRVLLFGVVDRTVTALAYGPPDAPAPLPVAADGSYLVLAAGTHPFAGQVLRVTRGTESKDISLQPPSH